MHGNKLPGPPPSFPQQAESMSIAHGRPGCWLAGLACWLGLLTCLLAGGRSGRLAGLQAGTSFPSQGHQGHLRGTPYRYRVPASANHLGVLAWPSMHGIVAPWAVLQVWRESDDVLPPPESNFSQHKWHSAQRTAHDMHACNTKQTPISTGSSLRFFPSEVSRLARASLCLGSL